MEELLEMLKPQRVIRARKMFHDPKRAEPYVFLYFPEIAAQIKLRWDIYLLRWTNITPVHSDEETAADGDIPL